jgi:allantoate deiminase
LAPPSVNFGALAEAAVARCKKLALITDVPRSTCRTFLSPAMRNCYREVSAWLEAIGATVTMDAAGNLRGVYRGAQSDVPRVLFGSHLDTVPDAGAYDGILGVVLAVSLLEALDGQRLPFAIEVVGFSEEEGVRFATPFIGSRALAGTLNGELLERVDENGISVQRAIEQFGLDPRDVPRAALKNDSLAYMEFHIEQGPILESLNLPLGVVEAIAGQTRAEFHFQGTANHAGTTPMPLRRDALAAAAEWIVEVDRAAKNTEGLVATVGRIEVSPNASNVIAGSVTLSLDVRHKEDRVRHEAVDALMNIAGVVAARRRVSVQHRMLLDQPAVAMDAFLVEQIEQAVVASGCAVHRMVSGAGHDAMIVAEKIPAAMIFLRSPGGISHHPSESVNVQDVAHAIECGWHLLMQLADVPDLQKRMHRA